MRLITDVLLPRFSLFFFNLMVQIASIFLLKYRSSIEIHRQKHFLTAKTAAKTTRPGSGLFVLVGYLKHSIMDTPSLKGRAVATKTASLVVSGV